jgi:hypothetical protein
VEETTLQTATVTVGDISITADGTGTLVPSSEVSLAFGSSGTLMGLLVEVGLQDYVNAEILSGLQRGEVVSIGEATNASSSSSSQTSTNTMQAPPDGGMMPMFGG